MSAFQQVRDNLAVKRAMNLYNQASTPSSPQSLSEYLVDTVSSNPTGSAGMGLSVSAPRVSTSTSGCDTLHGVAPHDLTKALSAHSRTLCVDERETQVEPKASLSKKHLRFNFPGKTKPKSTAKRDPHFLERAIRMYAEDEGTFILKCVEILAKTPSELVMEMEPSSRKYMQSLGVDSK
jgi:hypothetical protein